MLQLNPDLVRIPDFSFISWDQLPDREYPDAKVPSLYPNLAVEVLSAEQHPGRDGSEAPRLFRRRLEAGLVSRPGRSIGSSLYFARVNDPAERVADS